MYSALRLSVIGSEVNSYWTLFSPPNTRKKVVWPHETIAGEHATSLFLTTNRKVTVVPAISLNCIAVAKGKGDLAEWRKRQNWRKQLNCHFQEC